MMAMIMVSAVTMIEPIVGMKFSKVASTPHTRAKSSPVTRAVR